MTSKSAQAWIVSALGLALALVIAAHALLVQVDFDACFDNYVKSVSPGEPLLERVGEMSTAKLVSLSFAKIGGDELMLFGFALLASSPFVLAVLSAPTAEAARLWTVIACVISLLMIGFYLVSLSKLFGGTAEFHDCDRKGVSVSLALLPMLLIFLNLLVVAALGLFRVLMRSSSREGSR